MSNTANYQRIKQEYSDKMNAMLSANGVFYAFSDKQLKENVKEGVKYTQFANGAFVPSDNYNIMATSFEQLDSEKITAIIDGGYKEEHILYELLNHECYYTGEIDNTMDALPDTYTETEVWAVYRKYQYLAENW